jgi:hypothetical protein
MGEEAHDSGPSLASLLPEAYTPRWVEGPNHTAEHCRITGLRFAKNVRIPEGTWVDHQGDNPSRAVRIGDIIAVNWALEFSYHVKWAGHGIGREAQIDLVPDLQVADFDRILRDEEWCILDERLADILTPGLFGVPLGKECCPGCTCPTPAACQRKTRGPQARTHPLTHT